MYTVTLRAKPYQLALLIKKSLRDTIGTQQSAREATLQYQYQNIHFSLIYGLFARSYIGAFKEMCILQYMNQNWLCLILEMDTPRTDQLLQPNSLYLYVHSELMLSIETGM